MPTITKKAFAFSRRLPTDPVPALLSAGVIGVDEAFNGETGTQCLSRLTANVNTPIYDILTVSNVVAVAGGTSMAGVSETYTGTFVSPQGLATRPDRLFLGMVSYDPATGRAIVTNTVTRPADNGRVFTFCINGSDWLIESQFAALRFAAGTYYCVNMVEQATGDNNPFELEKRQLQQGYYVAEHSFIIH